MEKIINITWAIIIVRREKMIIKMRRRSKVRSTNGEI